MKRPSIHQLEVFCRVVQLGSMARAAEELLVAPSSVSMQIHELERRYKTRLLVRGPRRTVPTAAGAALHEQVVLLLRGLDAVERQLTELGEVERGTLRFAASRTIGAGVVWPVLQAFECAHPQVKVSYSIMSSSQSAKSEVLYERAEFALVGRVGPDWPLDVRPLFDEPLVVLLAPGHPLAGQEHVTLEDLRPHVLLLREPPVLGHERVLRLLDEAGVRPQIIELGSTEAVKGEAVAGRGIAVLPRTTVTTELTDGTLLSCSVEGFRPYRTVFLTSVPKTPLSPVAESFVRLIQVRTGPAGRLPELA